MPGLEQIRDSVCIVAKEYPIKKVELFGSYAENRNKPESDIDLLVEFFPSAVSLMTLNSVKYRLEELLKTEVDLIHAPIPEGSLIEINRKVPVYGA